MPNDAVIKKARKPRIDPAIRLSIVQLRSQGLSLDDILDSLGKKNDDRLPSRRYVAYVVKEWENLTPEIRVRDIPFELHKMELSRVPLTREATRILAECSYVTGYTFAIYVSGQYQKPGPQLFTNRLAYWCWRTSLLIPYKNIWDIIALADAYAVREMAQDLLPHHPPMAVKGYDDLLLHKSVGYFRYYELSIEYGTSEPLPDISSEWEQMNVVYSHVAFRRSELLTEGLADLRREIVRRWKQEAEEEATGIGVQPEGHQKER